MAEIWRRLLFLRTLPLDRAGGLIMASWYTTLETDLGWVALVASAAGLQRVVLPQTTRSIALQRALEGLGGAVADSPAFGDLPERMRRYFQGQRVRFDDRLDAGHGTAFLREVWEASRGIPYGETRSYSWVAGCAGRPRAARAVGWAMSRNPVPIVVPCHRVVKKDGGLGGFGGGLDMKRRLLELEGRGGDNG